jgi:hypothetical protein
MRNLFFLLPSRAGQPIQTVAAWALSLKAEPGTGVARADRWGIFVGEWAPTFFGLGIALSHYEQHDGTLTASVHELRQRREAS